MQIKAKPDNDISNGRRMKLDKSNQKSAELCPVSFEQFAYSFMDSLREVGQGTYWERTLALKELRTKYRNAVSTRPIHFLLGAPKMDEHLKSLYFEVQAYRRISEEVLAVNRSFTELSREVRRVIHKFEFEGSKPRPAIVKTEALEILEVLRQRESSLESTRKSHWETALQEGFVDTANFPLLHDPLSKATYPPVIVKRSELDARFQIRIATIFRHFIPPLLEGEISLRTVARLVVLVYVSSGLASCDGITAHIKGRTPALTVNSVRRQLRRAKLA